MVTNVLERKRTALEGQCLLSRLHGFRTQRYNFFFTYHVLHCNKCSDFIFAIYCIYTLNSVL